MIIIIIIIIIFIKLELSGAHQVGPATPERLREGSPGKGV